MRFTNRVNRKWVAWILFSVFYTDLCAAVSIRLPRQLSSFPQEVTDPMPLLETDPATTLPLPVAEKEIPIIAPSQKIEKPVAIVLDKTKQAQEFIDGPGQPEMSSFKP